MFIGGKKQKKKRRKDEIPSIMESNGPETKNGFFCFISPSKKRTVGIPIKVERGSDVLWMEP